MTPSGVCNEERQGCSTEVSAQGGDEHLTTCSEPDTISISTLVLHRDTADCSLEIEQKRESINTEKKPDSPEGVLVCTTAQFMVSSARQSVIVLILRAVLWSNSLSAAWHSNVVQLEKQICERLEVEEGTVTQHAPKNTNMFPFWKRQESSLRN